MKKTITLFIATLLTVGLRSQTTIPANFYGLNGWMPDYIGSSASPGPTLTPASATQYTNLGGQLYNFTNTAIPNLGNRMMRFGGTNADMNFPTLSQYEAFVTACNSKNITPVIQLPLAYAGWLQPGYDFTAAVNVPAYTSTIAAIVRTLSASPYNVKYYSIGNEPDAYSSHYGDPGFSITTPTLAACIRSVSMVIKTQNPYAIVIGPDISFYQGSIINGLITGNSGTDITATNSVTPSSPFCDIIAYHTYPMGGKQGRLTVAGKPANGFASDLAAIRTRISGSSPNPSKIKIAVTEMNVSYSNIQTGTVVVNGVSDENCNSFLAGQWMAEMYAYGLKGSTGAPVAFMMPWSLHESGGSAGAGDLGLINGTSTTTPQYRSTYIHTKMMTEQLGSGTFFMATPSSTTQLVKAWSASDCSRLAIMFMNQDSVNTHTVTFSHGTSLPGSYSDVGMKLNIVPTPNLADMTYTIAPKETRVLVFDVCGHLRETYIYNETMNSSYSSYSKTSTTTTRFCQCFKTVANLYPNYNLRCAASTETGTVHYNSVTLSSDTRITDSAFVTGTVTVPSGVTLTIDTAEVSFGGGAKIVVQSGGKLKITGSYLHGCADAGSAQWGGLQVNDANTTAQFTMTTTHLDGASTGVAVGQGYQPVITDNAFTNCSTGIRFNKNKGFTVTGNEFSGTPLCIRSASAVSAPSTLSENLFYEPDTTIIFKTDDNSQLSIGCNGFVDYTSYGIYATDGALATQGSSGSGAGNFFSSSSTYTNSQLFYTGSSMTYYDDPSTSFTLSTAGSFHAAVTDASADGSCDQLDNKLAAHGVTKGGSQQSAVAGVNAASAISASDAGVQLLDCHPNPSSGRITFGYSLADRNRPAEIWIRSLVGETLEKISLPAGSRSLETDLSSMSSGIYIYSLVIDGTISASKKLVINR